MDVLTGELRKEALDLLKEMDESGPSGLYIDPHSRYYARVNAASLLVSQDYADTYTTSHRFSTGQTRYVITDAGRKALESAS